MIYVFGDLRQLRSFELSRPQISPPKPLARLCKAPETNEIELTSASAPVRALTRPPAARVTFSSRDPMHPALRIIPPTPRTSSNPNSAFSDPPSPLSPLSPPPPVIVHTPLRTSTVPLDDTASVYSFSSYTYSDSEDSDLSDSTDSEESDLDSDSEKLRQSVHNQRRRPRIIISDAYYDEHPSPEGPATATNDIWGMPVRQEHPGAGAHGRRGSVGPGVSVGGAGGKPPLWPDYEANSVEETNATAAFIKPFVYDFEHYRFG